MQFFWPLTPSASEAVACYGHLREQLRAKGYSLQHRRIAQLHYQRDSFVVSEMVGLPSPTNGGLVLAIFADEAGYYVCTPKRGVSGGQPIVVGQSAVRQVIDFAP